MLNDEDKFYSKVNATYKCFNPVVAPSGQKMQVIIGHLIDALIAAPFDVQEDVVSILEAQIVRVHDDLCTLLKNPTELSKKVRN